jgi:RNA polymerase sigma factor FliA
MKPALSLPPSAPSPTSSATPFKVTMSDVREFMPIVRQIAARMLRKLPPNVLRDDLIADGTFGLVDALLKNGQDRGPKFEWYARTRIQGAMFDGLRSQDWLTRRERRRITSHTGEGPAPTSGVVAIEDLSDLQRNALHTIAPSPLEAAETSSERAALAKAVEGLDARERMIMTQHYFQGVEMKAIAAQLGVSDPRVSQLHARALGKLRVLLAPAMPTQHAA